MTASIAFLTGLVGIAVAMTAVEVVVLLTLWYRDLKTGRLW